jgi:hypothetical protein
MQKVCYKVSLQNTLQDPIWNKTPIKESLQMVIKTPNVFQNGKILKLSQNEDKIMSDPCNFLLVI